MDKDITKSTFLQYLAPINFEKFNEMIKLVGADKYTKKLTTFPQFKREKKDKL